MTPNEMDEVLTLLAASNPKTIFLELAFMESWVLAVNKHHEGAGIPGELVEASLPFFAREFAWRPRLATPSARPAGLPLPGWAARVAGWVPLALLGLAARLG